MYKFFLANRIDISEKYYFQIRLALVNDLAKLISVILSDLL